MNTRQSKRESIGAIGGALGLVLMLAGPVFAHCDSMNGPVVQAARNALQTGDFSKVQIWVGEDQESELKAVFEKALRVRELEGEAQELADRYFFETAVRLHREAEGMTYTGLKPAGPMPEDIQAAETALEENDPAIVSDLLVSELRKQTHQWFQRAMDARQNREQSVEAGRRWVDAYVKYVIYVHGLHQKIQADPAHGVGD